MTKRLFLLIGFGIFVVSTVFLISLFAQGKKTDDFVQNQTTRLNKVINNGGWEIPKFKDSEFKDTDTYIFEGTSVVRKLYVLTDYLPMDLNTYYLDSNNNLNLSTNVVTPKNVLTYSYAGKTFMYDVSCILGAIKNKDGSKIEGNAGLAGTMITVYYVDEDGDGKFESRFEKPNKPNKIPDWVTKIQN